MTKDVLISISGLQVEIGESEPVEVISVGQYYMKNDKHYILYDDMLEGEGFSSDINKNTVKIYDNQVEIMKKGAANVHMIFKENQKNMTYYNTPFGNLLVGIDTLKIKKMETEENITVEIDYGLDVNYAHISDCHIVINIMAKG